MFLGALGSGFWVLGLFHVVSCANGCPDMLYGPVQNALRLAHHKLTQIAIHLDKRLLNPEPLELPQTLCPSPTKPYLCLCNAYII